MYCICFFIVQVRNIKELQQCKHQLHQIKQQRQIQLLTDVELKQMNDSLRKQVKSLKEQVAKYAFQLVKANKYIKKLKQQIKQLQNSNIGLYMDNFTEKKSKLRQFSIIKQDLHSQLFPEVVKNFLIDAPFHQNNILIDYCRQCAISNNYQNFFNVLNEKLMHTKNNQIEEKLPVLKKNRLSLKLHTAESINIETKKKKKIEYSHRSKTLMPTYKNT